METFEDFLSDCGVNDPEVLIAFLENFSDEFDPSDLSEIEKTRLEESIDKVLEKITN